MDSLFVIASGCFAIGAIISLQQMVFNLREISKTLRDISYGIAALRQELEDKS